MLILKPLMNLATTFTLKHLSSYIPSQINMLYCDCMGIKSILSFLGRTEANERHIIMELSLLSTAG